MLGWNKKVKGKYQEFFSTNIRMNVHSDSLFLTRCGL
jgi:hypothetical protein